MDFVPSFYYMKITSGRELFAANMEGQEEQLQEPITLSKVHCVADNNHNNLSPTVDTKKHERPTVFGLSILCYYRNMSM